MIYTDTHSDILEDNYNDDDDDDKDVSLVY